MDRRYELMLAKSRLETMMLEKELNMTRDLLSKYHKIYRDIFGGVYDDDPTLFTGPSSGPVRHFFTSIFESIH